MRYISTYPSPCCFLSICNPAGKPTACCGQKMRLSSANPCPRALQELWSLRDTEANAYGLKVNNFPHDHLQKLIPEIKTQLVLQQVPPRPKQISHACWCSLCDSMGLCRVSHRPESTPLYLSKLSLLIGLTYPSLHTQPMPLLLCAVKCTLPWSLS